jgi:hypothetical protein
MRRAIWATALVVLAAGCSGGSGPSGGTPTASSLAVPSPTGVPVGIPADFDRDIDASQVPPDALVPAGATVTGTWYAPTGPSILVAYALPSNDPLHQDHGLVVWRRFPGTSHPWRPVFGLHDPAARGVIQIRATVGDVTGDASPDALTFEDAGGSGVCGTWRVIDLAANASAFERKTCDTTIDLSTDPVGLTVREAVFGPDDAHCCPSAMRVSVLTYDGSTDWTTVSATVKPS